MKKKLNDDVSSAENEFLSKLHKIVEDTINEEGLVLNNSFLMMCNK